MDIKLIQEKINLGRAVAILGVHYKALEDGGLPYNSLEERVSFVKGMVDGFLGSGYWEDAVRLHFSDSEAVRLFFGVGYSISDEDILNSTRRAEKKRRHIHYWDAIPKLIELGRKHLLLRFAQSLNPPYGSLSCESLHLIIRNIEDYITRGDRRNLFTLLGQRIMQSEPSNLERAYECFKKVDNKEAIDLLFDEAVKKARTNYYPLEDIAVSEQNEGKREEKLRRLIENTIPDLGGCSLDFMVIENLWKLLKEHKVKLSEGVGKKLHELAVSELSRYLIEKELKDQELLLDWAKAHARDEPEEAYEVFASHGYRGPEILEALKAKTGVGKVERVKKDYEDFGVIPVTELDYEKERRLSEKLEKIPKKDLRKLYLEADLETKAVIASILEDHRILRRLSRHFYKLGNNRKAYELWVEGKGKLDSTYIKGVRKHLLDEEITEYDPGMVSTIVNGDRLGQVELIGALVEKGWGPCAYEEARRLGRKGIIKQMRILLLEKDPREALNSFGYPKKRDHEGIEALVDKIAKECDVNKGELKEFVYNGLKPEVKSAAA